MAQPGYSFSELCREAHNRWLKPAEVLFILQHYEENQLTHELPKTSPTSGSLFLYNKRVLRFFRKDGHSWRKKKDGKTVGEAHEKLKAGNVEALNCYYAHGQHNPNFQRRSYWMLDQGYDHIVLVHYRDITEGQQSSGSSSQFSTGTPVTLGQSSSSYQYPGPSGAISGLYESNQSLSSPQSVEVASDAEMKSIRLDRSLGIRRISHISSSSDLVVNEAAELEWDLQRLKEQLSLNDETLEGVVPLCCDNQKSVDLEHAWKDHSESSISANDANDFLMLQNSVNNAQHQHLDFAPDLTSDYEDSLCWKGILDSSNCSVDANSQENNLLKSIENEMELLPTQTLVEKEADQWINFEGSTSYNNNDVTNCGNHTTLQYAVPSQTTSSFDNNLVLPTSSFLPCEVQNFNLHVYNSTDSAVDYNDNEIFNQGQNGIHLEADQFFLSHKQKFTIIDVSPEWGYASENTKVVIVGSFLCDPSNCVWACMFGDKEVPVEVIQAGVIRCLAPPLPSPGKISLSITCGNQESCSEVRVFEYRSKESSFANCSSSSEEASSKSPEELLSLVRLVQMLLSEGDLLRNSSKTGSDLLGQLRVGEDSWEHVIGAILDGSWTSSSTMAWLLQELLKDKLQQRLSPRSGGCEQLDSSLSNKEQGVLHLVSALGFEWALNPILNSGINIDFRDIEGWTALHWAARFGRERMVAALVAKGASPGALTHPKAEDPDGKTPAKIASSNGHKGLAGYLSEIELTSHLSSLTIEEDDNSKSSAEVEADIKVNDISQRSHTPVDQHSLAAVWNATQAAERIQAAFRAHSFRQRQQREAAAAASSSSLGIIDEYGILSEDIEGLSAVSKLAFRNARNHNTAALSIQKNYRSWKGRRHYLDTRHKVVKIQAHVRGHLIRKQYKVFCWAVGVLEKVVLRWRRKRPGLRGYEGIGENEEEDILKVFRKKKVDTTVQNAFKRVLSMVEQPEARMQYCRMLVKHQEATQAEIEREFEDPESEFYMTIGNDDEYQYIM